MKTKSHCARINIETVDMTTKKYSITEQEMADTNIQQERQAQKLAYGEMQYAIALEMKYKRLRYSHTLAQSPFCPPSWNL